MIPILHYPHIDVTDVDVFNTNGIGRLVDCISCICTEQRNGIYEIEFKYPVTGELFNQLTLNKIVACVPSKGKTMQPFIIYRRSAEINGVCTFNAYHYSYLLSYAIMPHQTYSGIAETIQGFTNDPLTLNGLFTLHTDKTTSGDYTVPGIASVKSLLFGNEGSLLDVFGSGEYDYDKTDVYLYANRGQDRGFTIRYGVNMSDLKEVLEGADLYDSVIPYWVNSDTGATVKGSVKKGFSSILWKDENSNIITDEYLNDIYFKQELGRAIALDLSDEFESQPTAAQLNARAETWLANNQPWVPKHNIEVDFVLLSQTEEYKDYIYLEDVRLCDTVHVIYPALGISASAKVIKTEWNVLLDRYNKIEIGQTVDDYKGYTGKLNIGGKTFKIQNGLITNTLIGD